MMACITCRFITDTICIKMIDRDVWQMKADLLVERLIERWKVCDSDTTD